MFPMSTNGGGQCFFVPDVCKTPTPAGPTPIPYPNTGMMTQIQGSTASSKVKILGKKAATKKTEVTMTSGDEAGTAGGGVKSNKFKGSCKYKKGSAKVCIQGSQAAHHTCLIAQNGGSNANVPPGVQVAPSQAKVTCMP